MKKAVFLFLALLSVPSFSEAGSRKCAEELVDESYPPAIMHRHKVAGDSRQSAASFNAEGASSFAGFDVEHDGMNSDGPDHDSGAY